MGFDQPVHWVILLILAGLLFGGYKKLPEMARSAGRSMRVFKTELKGLEDDDQARANAAQRDGMPRRRSRQLALARAPARPSPRRPAQHAAPAQPAAPGAVRRAGRTRAAGATAGPAPAAARRRRYPSARP